MTPHSLDDLASTSAEQHPSARTSCLPPVPLPDTGEDTFPAPPTCGPDPTRDTWATRGSPWGEAPWQDVDAVHESPSAHRWRKLWPLLRIAISVAGDLVLIKATFDHALRLDTFFSWTLAVGVTLVSVSLAWNGGIHLRKLVSDDTGRLRVGLLLGLSLVAWAVMGTGLFVLRYQEASSTTMAGNTTNGFAVSGPASSADQGRLLAWLLLAVFIGSGVLALIEGFATNSRAAQLRRLNPYLLGLAEQVAVTQGLLARLVANKAVHEHELRIVEQQRAEAEVATRALARELKALARVHIAQVLGNPSDSEVVHQVDPCGHSSRGSGDVTTAGASR